MGTPLGHGPCHGGILAVVLRLSEQALRRVGSTGPTRSAGPTWMAVQHYRRHEIAAFQAQADVLLTLATTQGLPLYVGLGISWQGWVLAMQGQHEVGLAQLHQGMVAVLATGSLSTTDPSHPASRGHRARWPGRGRDTSAGRGPGKVRSQRAGDVLQRRIGSKAPCCYARPRQSNLFSPGPGHCPSPAGQVLGATSGHEPEPVVAAAGQAGSSTPVAGTHLQLVHRGL